jgi:cyclopropane-fatty-acyl-phospholipid synthase
VELRDCRSVIMPASFDKIAQVEMFEHVGIDNHDAFLQHLRSLLRPRGLYFHQASTRRPTKDLAKFRDKTVYQNFATRYVFPGGELDHIGMTLSSLERNGFEVHDVEALREHFQKTVEAWADRLYRNRVRAAALVGEERARMWMFYLSLCAVAFERSLLNVFQVVGSRRMVGPSGYPQTR